jgi:predicted metal-dependent HD superfamily phosphohydrolase
MAEKSKAQIEFEKNLGIADHFTNRQVYVHNDDGSVSTKENASERLQFLIDFYESVQDKLENEKYRKAHNMDRIIADSKLISHYKEVIKSPQLVFLVLFYRFVEYHPDRTEAQNLAKSKAYGSAELKNMYGSIKSLREDEKFVQNYPETIQNLEFFDQNFVHKFEQMFDVLINDTIPPEFGQKYDEDASIEYNSAAWILDINNSIYGSDSSTFCQWEQDIRCEYCQFDASAYETMRSAQFSEILKKTPLFYIPIMNKEFGKYVKDNLESYDFAMYEPYEEDLEDCKNNLPKLSE